MLPPQHCLILFPPNLNRYCTALSSAEVSEFFRKFLSFSGDFPQFFVRPLTTVIVGAREIERKFSFNFPCAHNHSRQRSYKKLRKIPGKRKEFTEKLGNLCQRVDTIKREMFSQKSVRRFVGDSSAFVMGAMFLASALNRGISPRY